MQSRQSSLQNSDLIISSLEAELVAIHHLDLPTASSCCIYRVPPKLRKVNEETYTPTMVSIGPYHHEDKKLESMEKIKLVFLDQFLNRNPGNSLGDYIESIRNMEGEIRRSYSETISMMSDKFVRMILIDACFIIEHFLQEVLVGDDPWPTKPWSMANIRADLILLENQLPFFVLQKLFDIAFPNGYNNWRSFLHITFVYFSRAFLYHIVHNEKLCEKFTVEYFNKHHLPRLPDGTVKVQHLCDMLRIFYVRHDRPPREDNASTTDKPLYGASKLDGAGIVFEVKEDEPSLTELQYSRGVLKVPKIMFEDMTETMLRNVVALEQCHPLLTKTMTDYIILLHYLLNTTKDVELLVEKGIVENFLDDNDALTFIATRLDKNVAYADWNYASLFAEANEFCENPYHRHRAIFKQQYLSTPWKVASLSGAIMLLLLTLIQTICSVIALFQKK